LSAGAVEPAPPAGEHGGGTNQEASAVPIKNFRDIGGYASRFGGTVRTGRVFRSAQPSGASDEALAQLLDLDFKLIADLRHPAEQAGAPSPWPADYAPRIVLHTEAEAALEAPHLAIMAMRPKDVETADTYYLQLYEDLPYDPAYRRMFKQVLTALPTLDGRALIHCTLGKDRTGVLVALIHTALGVSPEDIQADFIKSGVDNDFGPGMAMALEGMRQAYGFEMPAAVLNRLISVQPTYLPRFFASVERGSGGAEGFLDEIGVTEPAREALRAALLER
jgi:protein tyrosine/serine phosphatase